MTDIKEFKKVAKRYQDADHRGQTEVAKYELRRYMDLVEANGGHDPLA